MFGIGGTKRNTRYIGEFKILGKCPGNARSNGVIRANYMSYGNTMHPFTQIQITDKGLDELAKLVENVQGYGRI